MSLSNLFPIHSIQLRLLFLFFEYALHSFARLIPNTVMPCLILYLAYALHHRRQFYLCKIFVLSFDCLLFLYFLTHLFRFQVSPPPFPCFFYTTRYQLQTKSHWRLFSDIPRTQISPSLQICSYRQLFFWLCVGSLYHVYVLT